ncbi:hypothetical protein [Nitrospirillum viridazoti]|uniref:hypothetical protein n=1 Tax=Nitrospirillum viridazoti TaxID=3144925 RepID=UPI00110FEED4|nr:hypothetical protein [Nitrospirillum amazonense]
MATAVVLSSGVAQATIQTTPWVHLNFYSTGWTDATIRVNSREAFFNPENCSSPDGYIVSPSLPGNTNFASALLTAYTTGDQVQLVIDGCYNSRPNIIGVYIRKP